MDRERQRQTERGGERDGKRKKDRERETGKEREGQRKGRGYRSIERQRDRAGDIRGIDGKLYEISF